MKQGAEYCLKNGILSLSDFEMLFKLGAITKTNVNYLMEFAAKYGQGDIVDFLFNTVKGGKREKTGDDRGRKTVNYISACNQLDR